MKGRFYHQIGRIALILCWLLVTAANEVQPPPCDQSEGPAGCIDLILAPDALVGDVHLDGTLIVPGVNATRMHVAPDTPHSVEVRNVADSTAGFGDLYVYDDASQANVRAGAGQVRQITLRPRQRYIRGILALTCDIRGISEGQVAMCRPTVDGTPQPDIAAGTQGTYHLTPGSHTVHIDLAGDHASLWAPSSADHTANVAARWTTTLRSTYNRKGLLQIGFNVANVVGDIYVDGALVASQVAATELFVAPGNHSVEAKALAVSDPAEAVLYRYDDVKTTTWVGVNQTRKATLYPRKAYLVGFAAITCQLNGIQAGEDARCSVTSDGQPIGTVESGATGTFNLPLGQHALAVSPAGAGAHRWGNTPVNRTLSIVGGRTSRFSAYFRLQPPTPTPVAPPTQAAPPAGVAPTSSSGCADPREFFDPLLNRCRVDENSPLLNENQDRDGDGYTPKQGDCDDNSAFYHPGADDPTGGPDYNCDGTP